MKILLLVLSLLFFVSSILLYQNTKKDLASCYIQAQDEMKIQLSQGLMTDTYASCKIGKKIFEQAVSCLSTVKNSGANMLLAPIVLQFNPKLEPENIQRLQNAACVEYPEFQI